LGLLLVEGPNDVIKLDTLGNPAVGLSSNNIAAEQIYKVARLATELSENRITVMFDTDEEEDRGTTQVLWDLARTSSVRLAWSGQSHTGKFVGRQPESLSCEEAEQLGLGRPTRT